jgi:hypothetical protein
MSRFFTKICLLPLLALLAACAAKMETEVTRFHQLPAPAAETIELRPVNPALASSLEFNRYADLVGAKFARLGYKPPVKDKPSDLIARIDYGVEPGPGPVRDQRGSTSVSMGMGVGGHHSSFGFGMSTAVGGASAEAPLFTRWIHLEIDRAADNKRLFEGRAVSQGKTGDLNKVMPYLIDALFTDFPGQSGAVKTVTVNAPE